VIEAAINMVISGKYRIIFVHLRKTGGESISAAIASAADKKCGNLYKHMTASRIMEKFPKKWNKYYKFCFVRNPWDLAVSFYFHLRKPLYVDWKTLRKQYPRFRGKLNPKYACKMAMEEPFDSWVKKFTVGTQHGQMKIWQDTVAFSGFNWRR